MTVQSPPSARTPTHTHIIFTQIVGIHLQYAPLQHMHIIFIHLVGIHLQHTSLHTCTLPAHILLVFTLCTYPYTHTHYLHTSCWCSPSARTPTHTHITFTHLVGVHPLHAPLHTRTLPSHILLVFTLCTHPYTHAHYLHTSCWCSPSARTPTHTHITFTHLVGVQSPPLVARLTLCLIISCRHTFSAVIWTSCK